MLWEPPVSEAAKDYRIDVLSGGSVAITYSAATETVTISASDQIALFGALQSSVDVQVYQMSVIVGAGYKGAATV